MEKEELESYRPISPWKRNSRTTTPSTPSLMTWWERQCRASPRLDGSPPGGRGRRGAAEDRKRGHFL